MTSADDFIEFASLASPRLRRTAFLLCGDWQTAEDLAQTTLAKMWAPGALAVTPDGRTLYVASYDAGTVTPIPVATGKPGRPVRVGPDPYLLAVTPDGTTVYALSYHAGTVTPVATATNTAGKPVRTGRRPIAIAR